MISSGAKSRPNSMKNDTYYIAGDIRGDQKSKAEVVGKWFDNKDFQIEYIDKGELFDILCKPR